MIHTSIMPVDSKNQMEDDIDLKICRLYVYVRIQFLRAEIMFSFLSPPTPQNKFIHNWRKLRQKAIATLRIFLIKSTGKCI